MGALRHNAAALQRQIPAGASMMAVVKANAYGHGLASVVRALSGRVAMFGVANVTEASAVREEDPDTPIFILGPALPEERKLIVSGGFVPAVSDLQEAQGYAALAGSRRVPIHLVIDTGMGRIGIWEEDALDIVGKIAALPGLEIRGINSHLPVADEDEDFTRDQIARFHRICDQLRTLTGSTPVVHVANSAGVIGYGARDGDMVRAGLALYGSSPIESFQQSLKPVLTWKTRVTLVREIGAGRAISYGRTYITAHPMRVATLAVGYADGFQRHLSNQGADVLISGKRCAVLGRVTMDQIVVDVSHVPGVAPGSEVVLIGRQGDEEILAGEMARKAGTIPWEILTSIGPRVVRTVV